MFRKWNEWAPLPLRIVMGISYTLAGGAKLFVPDGHRNVVDELEHFGLPFAEALGWILGVVEFLSGLLLLAGAFVALVAIIQVISFAFLLILSLFTGGIPEACCGLDYFPYQFPNYAYSLAIIAGLLTLLFGGAGKYSVDERRKSS